MQPRRLLAFFAARAYSLLVVTLDSEVLLCRAVSQLISPHEVLGTELISPPAKDTAFPLVELNENPLCPVLLFLQVPLKDSTSLWYINHTSRFCIICKFAEASLCLSMQVINEDIR